VPAAWLPRQTSSKSMSTGRFTLPCWLASPIRYRPVWVGSRCTPCAQVSPKKVRCLDDVGMEEGDSGNLVLTPATDAFSFDLLKAVVLGCSDTNDLGEPDDLGEPRFRCQEAWQVFGGDGVDVVAMEGVVGSILWDRHSRCRVAVDDLLRALGSNARSRRGIHVHHTELVPENAQGVNRLKVAGSNGP
jgi:hypothetical protein